jgi:hypothetical protein
MGVGKLVMESIVETKGNSILQSINGLRGELPVTWEEGIWAGWLYDQARYRFPVVSCGHGTTDFARQACRRTP